MRKKICKSEEFPLAKNIKEKSSEYFGLYDIFGKGADFSGTMLMGITTQISGSSKIGVAVICLMFVIGFLIFRRAVKANEESKVLS